MNSVILLTIASILLVYGATFLIGCRIAGRVNPTLIFGCALSALSASVALAMVPLLDSWGWLQHHVALVVAFAIAFVVGNLVIGFAVAFNRGFGSIRNPIDILFFLLKSSGILTVNFIALMTFAGSLVLVPSCAMLNEQESEFHARADELRKIADDGTSNAQSKPAHHSRHHHHARKAQTI